MYALLLGEMGFCIALSLCSLGVLEFLGRLRTQLADVCHNFGSWQESVDQPRPEGRAGDGGAGYQDLGVTTIRKVMLAVQRVVNSHRGYRSAFTAATAGGESH